jgi:hypothetical protein
LIEIKEIKKARSEIKKFIRFSWIIYKDDPNFVPPLIADQLKSLMGINNALFDNGEQAFYMAYVDGQPKARLLVGTNEQLNKAKGYTQGFLTLFECVNDQAIANAIFDAAVKWLKDRGMTKIIGPENYTYDDFGKGVQTEGFDGPPVLFGVYNPAYYSSLFDNYGFQQQGEHLAFFMRDTDYHAEKYETICDFAKKRFGIRAEPLDLDHHYEREIKDITYVLSTGMPDLLDQLAQPTEEDIRAEVKMLKDMADQELILLARVGDRPVGFLLAMPDYNQIIKHMNGHILSPALLGLLKERRRAKGKKVHGKVIDGIRCIVLFVIPEYQNKAVTGILLLELAKAAIRKGYKWCEGSTIDVRNIASVVSTEKFGAKAYRKYKTYEKAI